LTLDPLAALPLLMLLLLLLLLLLLPLLLMLLSWGRRVLRVQFTPTQLHWGM